MTRIDTLRAISAACRASHARSLFALGWLTLNATTEALEELLDALTAVNAGNELLDHLERAQRLRTERFGATSRLD